MRDHEPTPIRTTALAVCTVQVQLSRKHNESRSGAKADEARKAASLKRAVDDEIMLL